MTAESRAAAADLRAILMELHPHRYYDDDRLGDDLIGCLVLLRREMQMMRNDFKTFTKLKASYAKGAEPGVTAKPRGRKGAKE